jgi:hypothetical protein
MIISFIFLVSFACTRLKARKLIDKLRSDYIRQGKVPDHRTFSLLNGQYFSVRDCISSDFFMDPIRYFADLNVIDDASDCPNSFRELSTVIVSGSPEVVLISASILLDRCRVTQALATVIKSRLSEPSLKSFRIRLKDELTRFYFGVIRDRVNRNLKKLKPLLNLLDREKLSPLIESAALRIRRSKSEEVVIQSQMFLKFLESKQLYGEDSFDFKIAEICLMILKDQKTKVNKIIEKSVDLYENFSNIIPQIFTLTLLAFLKEADKNMGYIKIKRIADLILGLGSTLEEEISRKLANLENKKYLKACNRDERIQSLIFICYCRQTGRISKEKYKKLTEVFSSASQMASKFFKNKSRDIVKYFGD